MSGGGGLAICGGVGGWRKRWHGVDDDGGGQWPQFTRAALCCSCPLLRHCPTPDWRRPAGMGMRRLRSTTTTTPKPPHNTDALHGVKRPGCAHAHGQGKHRNTQPHSRRTVGGGRRAVKDAPRATWQGWRTTPRTPTLWPIECAAEEIGITRRAWSTGVVAAPWAGSDRSEGRRKAHSHSLVAGGGWEKGKAMTIKSGVNRAGVLYPDPSSGDLMRQTKPRQCSAGR